MHKCIEKRKAASGHHVNPLDDPNQKDYLGRCKENAGISQKIFSHASWTWDTIVLLFLLIPIYSIKLIVLVEWA